MHHSVFQKLLPAALVCFVWTASVFGAVVPEYMAGARSLLISPSTRVSGMGNAGVALTDEPSGYYNPAALAFASGKWNIVTTNYPGKMDWMEGALDSAATYSYQSFSLGGERRLLRKKRGAIFVPLAVNGALGYYRMERDLGSREVTDPSYSAETYTVHPVESAHNFVFSGSARFIAEIGAGATAKRVYSDFSDTMKADATAFDLGLLAKLPLVTLAEYGLKKRVEFLGLHPELDLSAGASWNNLGGKLKWSNGTSDPLPRNFTSGYAGSAGITYRGRATMNLVRFTAVRETYVPKVDGQSFGEQSHDKKQGWEFSFCETVTIREGQFDDDDGGEHYKTRGMTVSSDGLFKLIASRRTIRRSGNSIDYFTTHTSVNWSRFEYSQSRFNNANHSQFTIFFRL